MPVYSRYDETSVQMGNSFVNKGGTTEANPFRPLFKEEKVFLIF